METMKSYCEAECDYKTYLNVYYFKSKFSMPNKLFGEYTKRISFENSKCSCEVSGKTFTNLKDLIDYVDSW